VDFDAVTQALSRLVTSKYLISSILTRVVAVKAELGSVTSRKLRFAYVCGADHAAKCYLDRHVGWTDYVLAVARPGNLSVRFC
jgi:hypothetical protein